MEINPEELYNNVIRVLHDAIDGELTHHRILAEKSQILSLDSCLCLIGASYNIYSFIQPRVFQSKTFSVLV